MVVVKGVGENVSHSDCCLHLCPSCKVAVVPDRYQRCAGCQAKWWYVYDSCIGHGWTESLARCKADDSYLPMSRV